MSIEVGNTVRVMGQSESPKFTVLGIKDGNATVINFTMLSVMHVGFSLEEITRMYPVAALEVIVAANPDSIKDGDKVMLRTGSAPMSVSMHDEKDGGRTHCIWSENGKIKQEWFATLILKPCPDNDK